MEGNWHYQRNPVERNQTGGCIRTGDASHRAGAASGAKVRCRAPNEIAGRPRIRHAGGRYPILRGAGGQVQRHAGVNSINGDYTVAGNEAISGYTVFAGEGPPGYGELANGPAGLFMPEIVLPPPPEKVNTPELGL